METIKARVFRTESFGAVDGPGVRLVVFLQGCNFRCKYCHNPESWTIENPQAKEMTVEDVLKLYDRNKYYYEAGGITLSGGEPLMHPHFCLALAKECHERKIHLTIDTSASTYTQHPEHYEDLTPYVNLWLVDIKATNPMDHKYITGSSDLTGINFITLLEQKQKPYWARCVIVKDLNDSDEQLENLAKVLANLKYMQKYEILPYHDLGAEKYAQLGISYSLKNTLVMSYDEYDMVLNKLKQYIEKYKNQ